MSRLDPVACAAFVLAAFVLAGLAQTAWFRSHLSQAFAIPLDGGLTLRGRRIFGDHKTLRGFVVMVPATSLAFAWLASITNVAAAGLWPVSIGGYAALGAWAGLGFMVGELPNSFVKRQLGIAPGRPAAGPVRSAIQFLVDRVDSGLGMLLALSVAVPVAWMTWTLVLLIGPFIHWSFSVLMFRLGIKPRPA